MDPELADVLSRTLGAPIVEVRAVRGGDVAMSYAVDLADGRRVFAKTHPAAPAHFFTTEAAGLRWIRDGVDAAGPVSVPEVVAVSDEPPNHLVLEWIEEAREARTGAREEHRFGAALRAPTRLGRCLLRAGGPAHHRQPRPSERAGVDVAGVLRAEPPAPARPPRRDAYALPVAAIDGLQRVAGRLAEFGAAEEPPARLHGDLWAGNRLVGADGRHWLVDPAAHGGHREFDLAMMRLFGGFGAACFDAYEEVAPLAAGWQDRVPLHQIAPLVVHAIKFGGGYVPAASEAIARYA